MAARTRKQILLCNEQQAKGGRTNPFSAHVCYVAVNGISQIKEAKEKIEENL